MYLRVTGVQLKRLLAATIFGFVAPLVTAQSGVANAQTAPAPNQLPQGGNVTAGSAQINQSGNVMNIDQATQKAIINWQAFNVGQDATVNFNQPGADSATLNRVLDANPSQIFGRIVAPGQVILINPNGAYFAPSASVDVGGLIATTHELADRDFLDGNYQFKRNGASGKVINDGELKAKLDGYIALMAPEVRNQGVIVAERGTVALASGEHIQLDFGTGHKLQGITVTEQDFDAQIENRHAIIAEGGLVILSARATAELRASVIKNSGQIVASAGANTVTQKGGRIILEGNTIEVTQGSELIATGPKGGGEVLIGGDWQGGANAARRVFDNPNQIHQAKTVTVQTNTKIDVSATDQGDGGTVVVWSDVKNPDSVTTAQGEILARGGENGGDGGQIETSGAVLTVDGLLVDAGSVSGRAGLWLLDPYDYVIDSAAAQTIGTALQTTDVTVTTTLQNSAYGAASTQGAGNILLNYPIIKFQNSQLTTLSLKANRDIDMNGWSITGRLNLVMWSDTDGVSGGAVSGLGNITTWGGFVWVGGGATSTQFQGIDVPHGPTTGTSGAPLTVTGSINTYGGDIFMWSGNGTSSDALRFDGTTAISSRGFMEISTTDANGTSSGDITIRANEFEFLGFPFGQEPKIATGGGRLAILPSVTGGSFDQTIRTSMFEFEGTLGGLQIGSVGNGSELFVDSRIPSSIAGPVILFGSTVNVQHHITTSGAANGSVSITADTINLASNIIGTGAHTLNGDVVIQGDPGVVRAIQGSSVLFGSIVDASGVNSLLIDGNAVFTSAVGARAPLSMLQVLGSTRLEADVNTTSLQEYLGPVTLVGNRSVSSGTIVFRSSIDGTTLGSDRLQATVQTSLIFDGDVGGSIRLGSLDVSGPTTLGGDITTTGALSFAGLTTLADNSTLTGSGLRLAAVQLDGQVLTVHESGVGLISGVISDGTALGGALTMSGPGVLTLTDNGTYTGATTISNGTLIFSNNAPTTGSSGFLGQGKLIIRPVSDDFTGSFSTEDWSFRPDLSELTIGKFDKGADGVNDVDVIITQAITLAGDVFIFGANVSLLDDLTVSGSGNLPVSVRLQASGVVSAKGIDAPKSIIIDNSVGSGFVFISGPVYAGVDFRVLTSGTIFIDGDVTTIGGQLYDASVVVFGTRRLSGTTISFSSVDGAMLGQDDLHITGDTQFSGEVGVATPLRRLSVNGNTVVGGNIRTVDSLVLSDTTTLTGNRTLSGVGVNLEAVSLNGNRLTVNEGGVGTISGVISDGSTTGGSLAKTGIGTLTLTGNSTYTGATTVSSGILVFSNNQPTTRSSGFFGPGSLFIESVSDDFTSAFSTETWLIDSSLNNLRIGKSSASFDGNSDAEVTLAHPLSVVGNISVFAGRINASNRIESTGTLRLLSLQASESISVVDMFAPNSGSIYLGSQGSTAQVNVTGLLSASFISISSHRDVSIAAVETGGSLSIFASSGDIYLTGLIDAHTSNLNASGRIFLNANIRASSSLFLQGALVLSGDRTLTSSSIYFRAGSTVNGTTLGQESLTINGNADIQATFGNTAPLRSLSVFGASSLGSDVTTSGAQTFSQMVTLTGDRALTAFGINLGAVTLDGHTLTVNENGQGVITGVVSDGNASGGGLLKSGAGTLTLTANGTYTGATTISSGRLVLSNDAPATRSSGLTGAGELVIEPASDDFASDFSTAGWVFGADLGGLTIGKSSSADGTDDVNILVPQPVSIAGDILFTGRGVVVSGSLAATGNFSSIRIDARQDIAVTSVEAVNRIDLFSIASNIDVYGRLSADTVEIRSRNGTNSIVGDVTAASLYVSGHSFVAATISTTNDQIYFDQVTVLGHSLLSAPNVTFLSHVNGSVWGQQDLTITGNAQFNDSVGYSSALRNLLVSGTTQLSGDVATVGQIDFANNTSLIGNRALTGSGISLAAVTLNGHTLTIDESSVGTISGVISDGVTLGGGLITTGFGQLKLTANSTYTGATIISGRELVLANDAPTTQSSGFSGSGSLVIEPAGDDFANTFSTAGWTFAQNLGRLNIGKTSGFDGVADAGIVIASPISIDGEVRLRGAAITTGSHSIQSRSSGVALEASGDVTVAAVQSASRMRLWSYSGDIHVTDQLSSLSEISLGAFGLVSINGAVSADSLFVNSDAFIVADVATTQTQQYQGHVFVADSTTLRASEVLFMNRVDGFVAGQQALSIDANARFYREVGSSTALKSLSVSGSTLIGEIIKTTEEQTFTGPSQLLPHVLDARLSGLSVTFLSTVDADTPASQFLIVNGNARFDGAVGNTARLQGLYVSGDTQLGGNINATGVLELVGMTTLAGSHIVTGLGIRLGAVNLEGHVLTVSESGSGLISGVVADGSLAGGGLTMAGSGVLTLSANGTYTGPTVIANGGLVFSNDSPQTSSSGFSGAGQLFIQPTSTDFSSDFSTAGWVFDQSLGGLTIGTIMSANGRNDVGLTIAAPVLITGYFSAFGSTITGSQITTTTGSSSIVYIVASNSLVIDTVSAAGSINIINRGSGPFTFVGSMTSAGDVSIFSHGSISAGAVTAAGNISIRNDLSAGDIQVLNSLDSGGWIEVSSSGTIALDADVISIGGQTYTGEVVLSGDRVLQGTYARFYSTIDGTASGHEALSVIGDAIFMGQVGATVPLKSLNVSAATSLGGDITTAGSQTYNGLITLASTSNPGRMLTGTGISLGAIALEGHLLAISESVSGTISGVVSDGSVSGGGLLKLGAGTLTLTANSTYTGATTVTSGTLVLSNDAPTTRSSGFSGAGRLVIEPVADDFAQTFSTEGWSFVQDLGGLRVGKQIPGTNASTDVDLVVAGPLNIAGKIELFGKSVSATQSITANGVASDVWIHASDGISVSDITATGYVWLVNKGTRAIDVAGSMRSDDGVEVLAKDGSISVASITAADNISISFLQPSVGSAIHLAGSLQAGGWVGVGSAGTTVLGGDVNSIGSQTYVGNITLTGNRQLTGTAIGFGAAVDGSTSGQESLTITGSVSFAGDVGSIVPLGLLNVSGAVSLGGDITTTGVLRLSSTTTLTGNRSLTGADVSLGAVVLEGNTLTMIESGFGSISGVISDGNVAGGRLTMAGTGTLTLTADSIYTGPTIISSGSLVLSNDSPSSASSGFSGAGRLVIQPNSASFTNTFLLSDWIFSSDLGGLKIGKSGNSSDVVVDRDVTIAGTLTLIGSDITLTHSLRTGVDQDIVLAGSGDFINNRGALALGTSGTGRWIVYAADPDNNVYRGLDSSNEAIWNETYAVLAPSAVPTGNRYVFAGGPINAVTLTTTDATKIYGETIDLSSYYALSAVGYPGESGVYLPTTGLGSSTLMDVFLIEPMFVSSKAEPSASVGTSLITALPGVPKSGFIVTYNNIGLLTVVPRPIIIAADALQHKTYGEVDPTLTFTLEANASGRGLYGSDVFTGELARLPGEDTSGYRISQGTLQNSNYSVSFVDGVFTIRPKLLMVTAQGKSKLYGNVDPALTYTTDVALLAGDRFTGQLSRLAGEDVGSYGIELNTLTIEDGNGGNNYALEYTNAQLDILPPPITLGEDLDTNISGEARQNYTFSDHEYLIQSDSLRLPAGESPGELQVDASLDASYASVSLLKDYEQVDSEEMFCLGAVIQTGLACSAAVDD